MKKHTKALLIIAIVAIIAYIVYRKLNAKLQFNSSTEKIRVKKGLTFEIGFPWNVSSGPSQWWTFENENDIDIVEKVGEHYESNNSNPVMLGGGGKNYIKYKAVKKGTQTLRCVKGKGTEREVVRTIEITVE